MMYILHLQDRYDHSYNYRLVFTQPLSKDDIRNVIHKVENYNQWYLFENISGSEPLLSEFDYYEKGFDISYYPYEGDDYLLEDLK
jgi:hypothetical protein